jgi:hypothetical protein
LGKVINPSQHLNPALHSVDLPDSDYSLVLETEEGGAEADLQYVEVLEDAEGTQANRVDEGKPRCI